MSEINYQGLSWPLRDEVTAAQRRAWERLGGAHRRRGGSPKCLGVRPLP